MPDYPFLTPRGYSAPVTVSGALDAGRHTTLDATGGALSMSLPVPADVDAYLSVEKVDPSTNTVTVAGSIRGGGGTIVLTAQYQTAELRWNGSTWRVLADYGASGGGSSGPLTESDITGLTGDLAAKADLVSGVVPTSQIPALALTATVAVASQSAMLALTTTQVQPGDIAIRSDGAGTFILSGTDPSVLANWLRLNAPTDAVTSVNGQTGTVVIAAGDVGVGDATTTAKGIVQLAGDLTGTAASPALAAVGTAGTYGDGTHVPQLTTDSKGRVTTVTAVTITGAAPTGSAGGDLGGSFPNPTLANTSTARTNLGLKSGATTAITIATTAPSSPATNDLWVDTT